MTKKPLFKRNGSIDLYEFARRQGACSGGTRYSVNRHQHERLDHFSSGEIERMRVALRAFEART